MGRFIKQFLLQMLSARLGGRRRPHGVKGMLFQEAERRLLGNRRGHGHYGAPGHYGASGHYGMQGHGMQGHHGGRRPRGIKGMLLREAQRRLRGRRGHR